MSSVKSPASAPVVVVGSAGIDLTVAVKRIPRIGETVIGGTFYSAGGAKGANQAVAAARAGAEVSFVARIGRDRYGDAVLAGLRADRINVSHVTRDPKAPTAVAFIFVGRGGENSIAVASGANLRLGVRDVLRAKALFRPSGVLLVQLETALSAVEAAITLASRCGLTVILNPAPARAVPAKLLRHVAILTPNEHEAHALTGIRVTGAPAAKRAAAHLHRRGARTVIITLGARGVFVSTPEFQQLIPGFKVRAVDTTGAGDVFNGALAVAWARGLTLLDAVRFAQAAAALSVTRLGAQPAAPTDREIARFLARHR